MIKIKKRQNLTIDDKQGEKKMIKHVVCFKIKDKNNDLLQKTREILLSMKGNVPTLVDIEVGINALDTYRSYDIILITTLASFSDLEIYQQDHFHVSVVKKHMHSIIESSVSVDFNI